jgi:hypothetical protein
MREVVMLIATGCGLCGAVWTDQMEPAKCLDCGGDFCAGAPLGLLWLRVSFTDGPGFSLRLGMDMELRGHWHPDHAAQVRRAMFRVVDGGQSSPPEKQ